MARFNDWLTITDPKLFGEGLAEQFRLSQNELQKASEALAPAFALGFQRAMADPGSWPDLSRAFWAMVPGNAPGGSATPGKLPGQIFTEAFFGSDDLAGAVARRASLFSGIAPDTLQKLMPSLAMLTMQTMVRSTIDNMQRQQPPGLATGDFGAATAEMMRRGANAVEALSRPSQGSRPKLSAGGVFSPAYITDVFADALKTSLPWITPGATPSDSPARQPAPQPQAGGANPMMPFAAMFDAFAKGMQSAVPPAPRADDPAPAEAVPASLPPPKSEDSFVGEMMRSGQKLHEDYAKEMAALFERYGGERKPA